MLSRLLVSVTLSAAMAVFAVPAFAAGNVGSVNFQKLVNEAPQIKASDALLKQRLAPQGKAIKQQQTEVKDMQKSLVSLGPGTNSLERASAAQNLKDARKKLNNMESQYASTLSLRRHQLRANFQDVVTQDIELYANAHDYTVVVDSAVVYSSSATDITDEILAMLKAQYSKAQASAKRGQKGQ